LPLLCAMAAALTAGVIQAQGQTPVICGSMPSCPPTPRRRLMSVDTTTREALRLAKALETLAEDHDQGSLEERNLEAAAGLLRRLAAKPQPSSGEVGP
jgi:hypothetical protein